MDGTKRKRSPESGAVYGLVGLALVAGAVWIIRSATGAPQELTVESAMLGFSVGLLSSFALKAVAAKRATITSLKVLYPVFVFNAVVVGVALTALLVLVR